MRYIFEVNTAEEFRDELVKLLERRIFTTETSLPRRSTKQQRQDANVRAASFKDIVALAKSSVIVTKRSPGAEPNVTMVVDTNPKPRSES